MSHKFLSNASFHVFLNKIDQEFAAELQKKGCECCGRKLHKANYPRSTVGLPAALRPHYDERLSFCCELCRKRATPQTVRFFARRWYPAPLFLLISLLMLGVNERRLAQIKRHLGIAVSESTWKRWRRWWREVFEASLFWQQAKGLAPSAIETKKTYPRALLTLFKGNLEEKMCWLLRFLAPLSGCVLRAV